MDHREKLLAAFGLGPADLEANRSGRLSATQARRLARSGLRDVGAALLVGVILAAVLLFVADRPLRPAQWITASVLFAAVLAVGVHHYRRVGAAASAGLVERVTGLVSVRSRGRQGWYLMVADREFRLPVRPWNVESGSHCHVYYAPRANLIVAIEPADGA